MRKIAIRFGFGLLAVLLLYVAVVLIHGTTTDYQPAPLLPVETTQTTEQSTIQDSVLSFTIWNIGYAGLGAESDFFYDGGGMLLSSGKMVRSSEELVEKNRAGALEFVKYIESDFFLLQEVDLEAKRSYYTNQFDLFADTLPSYSAAFALNYNASRVPLPLLEPWKAYGKVQSGLASYARFQPQESSRYQLPGDYAWPTRIFQLDRCALLQRYPLANGKELVVVNVHLSAFDKGGKLKKEQMGFLRKLLLEEYEKGHYVVVGGDWNQCPPFFPVYSFQPDAVGTLALLNIAPEFMPEDWRWAYDPRIPTNRSVANAYDSKKTFTTLIDFFLVSPNVKVLQVKGMRQDFQFSDHQPVWLQVELL